MKNNKSNISLICEQFSPDVNWVVEDFSSNSENKSEIDGKVIIGRVTGQFFVPGGTSRNDRYYSESLWEKVLKDNDVVSRMSERKMYGTIGHDEEPVSEKQLRNGEVSHIVTKLWIDTDPSSGKRRGMGEALILGTTAGQNLNIYLRAGSRLNTSSRASGKFLENKTNNGVPVVDEDSFLFETFDFVLDPGFLEANPSLVEKLQSNIELEKEESAMSESNKLYEASVQTLIDSRDSLKSQLDSAITEKNEVESKLKSLTERLDKLGTLEKCAPVLESLGTSSESVAKFSKVLENLNIKTIDEFVSVFEKMTKDDVEVVKSASISESMKELREFREKVAPTPDKGIEIGERVSKELEKYRALGKPEAISRVQEDYRKIRQGLKELGELNDIKEALTLAKKEIDGFNELGTRKEIEEALKSSLVLLNQYRKCGAPSKIMEALRDANKLADFVMNAGGKKKIMQVFQEAKSNRVNKKESAISRISENLSTKHRVPVSEVRKLVEKVGVKEAGKLLSSIKGSKKRVSNSVNESYKENTEINIGKGKSSLLESAYSQAAPKRS